MNIKSIYIKLTIASLCVILFFTTCKKYDEDKFYSWRTAKQRLEGEWQITSVLQNGNDITTQYNDSLPMPITDYYFWFNNNKIGQKQNYFIINTSSKKNEDAINNPDILKAGFTFTTKKMPLK